MSPQVDYDATTRIVLSWRNFHRSDTSPDEASDANRCCHGMMHVFINPFQRSKQSLSSNNPSSKTAIYQTGRILEGLIDFEICWTSLVWTFKVSRIFGVELKVHAPALLQCWIKEKFINFGISVQVFKTVIAVRKRSEHLG